MKLKILLVFIFTYLLSVAATFILSPITYILSVIAFVSTINLIPLFYFVISWGTAAFFSRLLLKDLQRKFNLFSITITALLVSISIFLLPSFMQFKHSFQAGLPLTLQGKQKEMDYYLLEKYSIIFKKGYIFKHRGENQYSSTFFLPNDHGLGIVVTMDEKGMLSDSYHPQFFEARQKIIKALDKFYPDHPLNEHISFAVTPVRVTGAGVSDGSLLSYMVKEKNEWTEKEMLEGFFEIAKLYKEVPIEQFDSKIFPNDMYIAMQFYEAEKELNYNRLLNEKYGTNSGLKSYHERVFYERDFKEHMDARLKYMIRVPYNKLESIESMEDVKRYLKQIE